MKKTVCLLLALMTLLPMIGCSCERPKYDFEVDLGNSSVYSNEELEAAIDLILAKKEASSDGAWKLSKIYRICYSGEVNDYYGENTAKFLVSFHTPKYPISGFAPDSDHEDYQFTLVKNDEGEWVIKNRGYC